MPEQDPSAKNMLDTLFPTLSILFNGRRATTVHRSYNREKRHTELHTTS